MLVFDGTAGERVERSSRGSDMSHSKRTRKSPTCQKLANSSGIMHVKRMSRSASCIPKANMPQPLVFGRARLSHTFPPQITRLIVHRGPLSVVTMGRLVVSRQILSRLLSGASAGLSSGGHMPPTYLSADDAA